MLSPMARASDSTTAQRSAVLAELLEIDRQLAAHPVNDFAALVGRKRALEVKLEKLVARTEAAIADRWREHERRFPIARARIGR